MRIPRLYVDQPIEIGATITLPTERAHYITHVLRLREGDRLITFSGDGAEFLATLDRRTHKQCTIRVRQLQAEEAAPALRIHLWLGLSKGDRMDIALQKAVELGVSSFNPVICTRSVVRLSKDREGKRLTHWLGVMTSACEQSGRCRLVDIASPNKLTNILRSRVGQGIILDPAAGDPIAVRAPIDGRISLLIGPEGGFTEDELDQAIAAGFHPVRLGRHTLRAETAPIAAIAAIQTLWGEFR